MFGDVWLQARSLQGYWEELQWSTEKMKYFEAVPNPRYRASQNLPDWTKLLATLVSSVQTWKYVAALVSSHIVEDQTADPEPLTVCQTGPHC